MSRPIDGEGTIRYSTGRPGREKAPAVAEPPARQTTPGSRAAAMAATANRRAQWPRILSTNVIDQTHPSSGYRVTRLSQAITDRHTAPQQFLHCAVAPALMSPVRRKSGPRKFQLCVCSKTCDQHVRHAEWRRPSFSCDKWNVSAASVFGRDLPLIGRTAALIPTNARHGGPTWAILMW